MHRRSSSPLSSHPSSQVLPDMTILGGSMDDMAVLLPLLEALEERNRIMVRDGIVWII